MNVIVVRDLALHRTDLAVEETPVRDRVPTDVTAHIVEEGI